MSAAFDSQAVAAKPLASLSPLERANLKAKLDTQHQLVKGCFAEALAADGSYASLVPLHDAIVVNFETEEQYQLDGEHPPDHVLLRDDLQAAMAKAGQGGQTGAAWVRRFRAKYDAHDEIFDEPAFGSLQAPSSSPCRSPAPPRDPPLPPHYLTLGARRAAYLAPIGRGRCIAPVDQAAHAQEVTARDRGGVLPREEARPANQAPIPLLRPHQEDEAPHRSIDFHLGRVT